MCSVARARAPPAQYTEQRRERAGTQRIIKTKVEELGDGQKRGMIWSQCVHIVNTRPVRSLQGGTGIICIPATSVPSKSICSKTGQILDKGNRFNPSKLRHVVSLHANFYKFEIVKCELNKINI